MCRDGPPKAKWAVRRAAAQGKAVGAGWHVQRHSESAAQAPSRAAGRAAAGPCSPSRRCTCLCYMRLVGPGRQVQGPSTQVKCVV